MYRFGDLGELKEGIGAVARHCVQLQKNLQAMSATSPMYGPSKQVELTTTMTCVAFSETTTVSSAPSRTSAVCTPPPRMRRRRRHVEMASIAKAPPPKHAAQVGASPRRSAVFR